MMLTLFGKRLILPAVVVVTAAAGFGSGVWWATATPTTFQPVEVASAENAVYAEESTTILPAKPKNRLTLPDGTSIESDEPITLDVTETGDGATFASSGEAVSPGIRTNAGEQALKLALQSGVPVIIRPDGTFSTGTAVGGGGSFDIDLSASTGWLLIALGSIVFLAGPAGFIFGRKIGVGLSLTEAGMISGAGLVLAAMGLYPALASTLILVVAGIAAALAGLHLWKSKRVGSVWQAAGKIVKAVDDLDVGQESPGAAVKARVSASVGEGTALEAVIDKIVQDAGA